MQIKGVEIVLNSTIFVQSHTGDEMTIDVLDWAAQITSSGFTARMPSGVRATIPMSDVNTPAGIIHISLYSPEEVANLRLTLLPEEVEPTTVIGSETPQILGADPCSVLSGSGEVTCPLHFINPDGDQITQMDVEFVSAPQGDWTGSMHEFPTVLDGDNASGRLAWNVSCTLGNACFIGPVVWTITLTDEAGHVSEPFEASFNCVSG